MEARDYFEGIVPQKEVTDLEEFIKSNHDKFPISSRSMSSLKPHTQIMLLTLITNGYLFMSDRSIMTTPKWNKHVAQLN